MKYCRAVRGVFEKLPKVNKSCVFVYRQFDREGKPLLDEEGIPLKLEYVIDRLKKNGHLESERSVQGMIAWAYLDEYKETGEEAF